MKFIIGKKIDMSQVWQEDKVVAVTRVQAGPCVVVDVKSEKRDGYSAVQLGYGVRKEKNIKKPQKGHMKGLGNFSVLKEFRQISKKKADAQDFANLKKGDQIKADTFQAGDSIEVNGTTKGKGFQGVVKRHGFGGSKKTHGNKDQLRMPGSIGATGPAHVFKGMRMGGRMGADAQTIKNLEIVDVDIENNIILIKGPVPGVRGSLVFIKGEGELKISETAVKTEVANETAEKIVEETEKAVEESVEKIEDKK
jgi:large subunit ribosomal protein L3